MKKTIQLFSKDFVAIDVIFFSCLEARMVIIFWLESDSSLDLFMFASHTGEYDRRMGFQLKWYLLIQSSIWRFPKGWYQKIHQCYFRIVHETSHPASLGTPMTMATMLQRRWFEGLSDWLHGSGHQDGLPQWNVGLFNRPHPVRYTYIYHKPNRYVSHKPT